MYKSTITWGNKSIKQEITNEDEEQQTILKLFEEIDKVLGSIKQETPEIKKEECPKPKDKPNCLIKIRMREGNPKIAKMRLRDYAERYGRVQRLWVETSKWSINGYILFDNVLGARRCLRDKEAMFLIKNIIN